MRRVFDLEPDFELVIDGIRYATNNHGFRDETLADGVSVPRDYFYRKPPGVKRLLVFGGSAGFGVGLEVGQTFPNILQLRLNRQAPRTWEVYNLSMPGDNLYMRFAASEQLAPAYSADALVFYADPFSLDMPMFVPVPISQAEPIGTIAECFLDLWDGFTCTMTLDVPAGYHRVEGYTNTMRALTAMLRHLDLNKTALFLLVRMPSLTPQQYFDFPTFRIQRECSRLGMKTTVYTSANDSWTPPHRVPPPGQQIAIADKLAQHILAAVR